MSQFLSVFDHQVLHFFTQRKRRKYSARIARVNTGRLDVFHHSQYVNVFAIANTIAFSFFRTIQEVINQHPITWQIAEQFNNRLFQVFVVDDNHHPLSTQHITRSNQHRITHLICNHDCLFSIEGHTEFRIRNI